MIENEVSMLERPCTTWMYSGMRKFAAVPTNSIVAMHAVTARSDPVASTRRSKMRGSALTTAAAQPREEHLPDDEAEDHEQRRGRDAEHVERRLRRGEPDAPASRAR